MGLSKLRPINARRYTNAQHGGKKVQDILGCNLHKNPAAYCPGFSVSKGTFRMKDVWIMVKVASKTEDCACIWQLSKGRC